ncbi:Pisatin demethylase [Pyrenophora teres f. maculata]|nr:Pisatin demethylase [Pyrenophora teres f. maculata]
MFLFAQPSTAIWLLLAVALAGYVVKKHREYRRLEAFPGPLSTGWSEMLHIRAILSRRSHVWYKQVTDQYGPIARIGPNELITSSPDVLARMSGVRSPYTRSTWYYAATRMEVGKDHVFSLLDEAKHTKRRQQMASGYSGKENLSLESDIDEHVRHFLELIRSRYLSTPAQYKPVDLAKKVQYLTLDVISKIGFGKAFGDLEADADLDGYISSSRDGMFVMNLIGGLGVTQYFHWAPIARLIGPSEKDKTGFGKMMTVARELIDSRLEKPTDGRSDMLASFIRHGLPRDDLVTESVLQILAGSDTTATAIRATMLYLMTHQRVYRNLQVEIDAAASSGHAAPAPDIVSDETLRSLPYLTAVVYEAFRIHPPLTDIAPKKVPPGGDTVVIGGKEHFLPGGTNVGYSVYGLQHDKGLFGQDADYFRPERWLLDESADGAQQEHVAAMKRTTEMIFGSGKYQCLGKPIAWLETRKVIFEFLRHFDWALACPEKPWTSANYHGVFLQEDMWVTVTARERGVD